jgi:hypothetical protein
MTGMRHREVDQGELEQRTGTGQEREARTADLRTALGVDRAEQPTDVEVVADVEVVRRDLADLLENDEVRLTTGRGTGDDVGHGEVRGPQGDISVGLCRLRVLDLGGESLGLLEDRRALLRGRTADRLRDRLLLAAQGVGARDGGPSGLVRFKERIDERRVVTASLLRGAHHVGVVAQRLEIDHGAEATGGASSSACAMCRS